MRTQVLGIQKVDYTNKQNRQVTGTTFHVSFDDANVDGLAVDNIYISSRYTIPPVMVGDTVDFYFDRRGNFDNLNVVAPKSGDPYTSLKDPATPPKQASK